MQTKELIMRCRATRDGQTTRYIEKGQEFDAVVCPSWAEPVGEIKEPAIIQEPEVVDNVVEDVVEDELDSLRAEAKELGYRFAHSAGKKKLQSYIAKHKK
jgi:hypothetical protein